ncbi:protein FAM81B-like isoform X2 [Bolinopsis microptera]
MSSSKQLPSKNYDTDKIGFEASLSAKEDILDKIGSSPIKNKNLSLLHDHIKDMTSIVRRLSRDMERCEGAVSSNTAAINTLSARLATLEGGSAVNANMDTRINRCDVGITELVREVKECNRNINKVKQVTEAHTSVLTERNRTQDSKVLDLEQVIGKLESEQSRQIANLRDQTKELGTVSVSLERGVTKDMSQLREACLNRVDRRIEDLEERCTSQFGTRDQRIDEINESLASAVEQINREVEKLKEKQTSTGKQVTQNETDGSKTISRLRGECMSGFKTLQESIDTMHSILDSKIELVEDEVRSEIRKAMKTVVLT